MIEELSQRFGMTFAGEKKPYVLVQERKPPYWAAVTNETQKVPGMAGAFVTKKERDVKMIPLTLIIHGNSRDDFQRKVEEVAAWLNTDHAERLEFDAEPGRYYLAELDGSIEPSEVVSYATIDIDFLCADPYKYEADEKSVTFTTEGVQINNTGSAPTKPVFELTVLEDTPFMQIAKSTGEYMQIGNPAAIEEVTVNPRPIVLSDDMSDITRWSTSNLITPENGVIKGSFVTDGALFRPNDFGTGTSWHGPAMRRSLPKLLNDFYIEVVFQLNTYNPRDIGRLELYLIDSNEDVLGKIALKDNTLHEERNMAELGIGSWSNRRYLLDQFDGYKRGSYNQFYGRLFLRRDHNEWWGQTAIQEGGAGGRYVNRSAVDTFKDVNGLYDTPLSAIQIHAATNGTHWEAGQMFIHHINVRELNQPTASEIPLIAEAGDKIIVNHRNGEILVDGNQGIKSFGSTFFPLDKGQNGIYAFPETAFETTVKYNQRYL